MGRVRKGEKVVQETTGMCGNAHGQATPARSKVKQKRSPQGEVAARHLDRKVRSFG